MRRLRLKGTPRFTACTRRPLRCCHVLRNSDHSPRISILWSLIHGKQIGNLDTCGCDDRIHIRVKDSGVESHEDFAALRPTQIARRILTTALQ